MDTWALIQNDIVVNIIKWDGGPDWTPPDATVVVNITGTDVEIGWLYNPADGTFSAPVQPDPPPE